MSETQQGLFDLALDVEVWLASEPITLKRLLELRPGHELDLTRDPDEPLDLVVNGSVVASGELVVIDDHFGFRVTQTAQQRLAQFNAGSVPTSNS